MRAYRQQFKITGGSVRPMFFLEGVALELVLNGEKELASQRSKQVSSSQRALQMQRTRSEQTCHV
jgi:hypothetical protein